MSSPLRTDIFTGAKIESSSLRKQADHPPYQGHDLSAIKTYRYLRIAILVAIIALAASIIEEYLKPGVGCFMGSLSGYFYSPVHSVFISVMVAVGVALLVIKGKTALEDTFLSLAGIMAPVVAFLPTTDDPNGACRNQLLTVHDYLPQVAPYTAVSGLAPRVHELLSRLDPKFSDSSIRNNLVVLFYAGVAAIVIVFFGFLFQRWRKGGPVSEYTRGFWVNLGFGAALVLVLGLFLEFGYGFVLMQHAKAACAMLVFLAFAAITCWAAGPKERARRERNYARAYGAIGALMLLTGLFFVFTYEWGNRSWFGNHFVLVIEATEMLLFFVYWLIQTVDRWVETV